MSRKKELFDLRPYRATLALIRIPNDPSTTATKPDPADDFGTGFFVTEHGLLLTAAHNVTQKDSNGEPDPHATPLPWVWVCCYNAAAEDWTDAHRVKVDPALIDSNLDAAVLRIPNVGVTAPLPIMADWQRGDTVAVLGFQRESGRKSGFNLRYVMCRIPENWDVAPLDIAHDDLEPTLRLGFIDPDQQPLAEGISGGPVMNLSCDGGPAVAIEKLVEPAFGLRHPEVKTTAIHWLRGLLDSLPDGRDITWLPPRKSERETPTDPRLYLDLIKTDNLYLDIGGIGRLSPQKMELREVYTKLRVVGAPEASEDRRRPRGLEEDERLPSERSLDEVLADHPHAVLVGDPGSGKTTFLRFAAQNLARACLGESQALEKLGLAGLDGKPPFPIVVRLRDLVQFLRQDPSAFHDAPEQFYRYLDSWVRAWPHLGLPADYLRRRVLGGACYLLLDGLDEVPGEEWQQRLGRVLEHVLIAGQAVGNRHLVTCRSRAYEGRTRLGGAFATFYLADFGRAQVETFVRNWSQALPPGRVTAEQYGNRLLAAIDANPHVGLLTTNPLMLTVVAIVYWHAEEQARSARTGGQAVADRKLLPEQRAELYEQAVRWLLESQQHLVAGHDAGSRKRCLRQVALRMLEDPSGVRRSLDRGDAARAVQPDCARDLSQGLDFLEQETLHSGLLVSRVPGQVEFWHPTFGEYLAALELSLQDNYWGRVEPHLHDHAWSEVVLLLAGCLLRLGTGRVSDLITRILAHDRSRLGMARAVGLIGRILRDVHPYEGDPVEKGTGYAEALRATLAIFEPGGEAVDERTRVEVGEALGQAGDPRLHDRQVNLVHLPGGTLWMGAQKTRRSNRGFDEDAVEDEAPVHSVSVADFLIGCYPVTVSEYAAFVEARQRGYLNSRHWTRDGWE